MASDGRSKLVFGSADLEDDAATSRLLDRFYEAGGRALDVANVYGEGESQRAIGKWLGTRGLRDEIVLHAKGCHPPYCSPDLAAAEVDKALADLGVDQVDVFLLHRDDPSVAVGAFGDALLEQVAAGKIRGFGVSNWTLPRFRELAEYLGGIGEEGLVAFSNHFSLGEMVTPTWPGCLAVTREELRSLTDEGFEILAWASLAMGYFAGREAPNWDCAENEARRRRASELAEHLGTTANAVALSYVLHQPGRVRAVFGTRSEAHLDEALSAPELELTLEQLAWLEAGSAA